MTIIDIKKKKISLGVLGKQISYSLSPVIYKTWFDHFGLIGRCDLIQKEVFDFDDISQEIKNYDGWAVTVPFKEKMFEWLKRQPYSSWGALVDSAGVVNIIKNHQGVFEATNTDAKALDFLLSQQIKDWHSVENVLILGNGGVSKTTKAVLLGKKQDISIFIASRSGVACFEEKIVSLAELRELDVFSFDMVVNATPLGTSRCQDEVALPQIKSFLNHQKIKLVIDWVYDLEPTFFEKCAREMQISFIGGLDLLIQQAAFAFEFWFGLVPPIDLAKQAIQNHLKK